MLHLSHKILKKKICDSSPSLFFLMFSNKIINFELHPHRQILMYEKGGVRKHIKAPAIVKVELIDL